MILRAIAFIVVLSSAVVPAAYADPLFALSSTSLSATAGGSVEFSGTIKNTGADDLYLNGDVSILPFSFLSVDDSQFFENAPLFLTEGDSYSGPLFDVVIDLSTVAGTYGGSYTIQGGSDSNTFQNLGTAEFNVNVNSTVPEPPSLILCFSAILLVFVWSNARNHSSFTLG